MRPDPVILVTGTGTEVGKTWVAARLVRAIRHAGAEVCARKPVQSFAPGTAIRDAEVLADAARCSPDLVCPPHRSYPLALAPPIAAESLGLLPYTIGDLVQELDLPPAGHAVIECAGGWRSPLASDGDARELAELIQPDLVVVVAPAALGAIHAVRSCLESIRWPATVFLNRYDANDRVAASNLAWLRGRDGLDVITEPGALLSRVIGAARPARDGGQDSPGLRAPRSVGSSGPRSTELGQPG